MPGRKIIEDTPEELIPLTDDQIRIKELEEQVKDLEETLSKMRDHEDRLYTEIKQFDSFTRWLMNMILSVLSHRAVRKLRAEMIKNLHPPCTNVTPLLIHSRYPNLDITTIQEISWFIDGSR